MPSLPKPKKIRQPKTSDHDKDLTFGFRMPDIKGSIKARLSVKRFIRHRLGLKMPRGTGWLSNPHKAMYNRYYSRFKHPVWQKLIS